MMEYTAYMLAFVAVVQGLMIRDLRIKAKLTLEFKEATARAMMSMAGKVHETALAHNRLVVDIDNYIKSTKNDNRS